MSPTLIYLPETLDLRTRRTAPGRMQSLNSLRVAACLSLVAALTACATSPAIKKESIPVDQAQKLIAAGRVKWVTDPHNGCKSLWLRDGTTFCWEPQSFDLQSWVIGAGYADKVDGLIIE